MAGSVPFLVRSNLENYWLLNRSEIVSGVIETCYVNSTVLRRQSLRPPENHRFEIPNSDFLGFTWIYPDLQRKDKEGKQLVN